MEKETIDITIRKALLDSNMNLTDLAKELGITRDSVYGKMRTLKFTKTEMFYIKTLLKIKDE